ncbi:macrophage migration inhibitory factor [Ancylostoma caninum]|uniref:Macrophage migration inhibitory factor n=1 Tax=Ancylostoma caninum TaxID=29170 RepID=A0A368GDQ5_ANCCA|nr:macrophage migration inhibitory factor [Ancylostoma caninum]
MPMVRVATNLPDKDVPSDFEEGLTDLLAESLNRPRKNFFIEVLTGQRITHGASRNPVAVIKVESLGSLSADDNIRHSQKITQFCQDTLKLPKDKVIITYFDLQPIHVGFNGTTVAAATL